jgi:hypothetical protein
MDDYDTVYTITDWYDGPRAGVADLNHQPHYNECHWDHTTDDWSEEYLLSPIDEETLRVALEDWEIWRRWRSAFDAGKVTLDTHPALPEDRARHDQLGDVLAGRLALNEATVIRAKGEFKYGEPTLVRWTIVGNRAI